MLSCWQPMGRSKSKFQPGVTDYSVIMTVNTTLILDSFADDFESHIRTCVFHILYVSCQKKRFVFID
jgi:hypothetical protein